MVCKFCQCESEPGARWHERGDPCCEAIQELRRELAETKLKLANSCSDLARYTRLYHELAAARLPDDQQEYLHRKRRLEAQQEAYRA